MTPAEMVNRLLADGYKWTRVYSGKPGCGCGCRGKYSESVDRGFARVLTTLLCSLAGANGEKVYVQACSMAKNEVCVAVEGARYYWGYLSC